MKELPDKSIDLVLTDPPYGIQVARRGSIGTTSRVGFGGGKFGRKSGVSPKNMCRPRGTIPLRHQNTLQNFSRFKNQSSSEAIISVCRHRRVGLYGIKTMVQMILQIANWRGQSFKLI